MAGNKIIMGITILIFIIIIVLLYKYNCSYNGFIKSKNSKHSKILDDDKDEFNLLYHTNEFNKKQQQYILNL
jgi:uncharacterized protein YxeA